MSYLMLHTPILTIFKQGAEVSNGNPDQNSKHELVPVSGSTYK